MRTKPAAAAEMDYARVAPPPALSARRWIVPLAITLWLISAVVALAWHFGPGREVSRRSAALEMAERAKTAAACEDWQSAAKQYVAALAALPAEDRADRDRLTLEHAVARIQIGELVEAQDQLKTLIADLERSPTAESQDLLTAARHEAATASYFAAWLMRLEGATPAEWKVEAEEARQQFHLLAEQAVAAHDADAELFEKNLEATIKLEQMDHSELLARALPKKCPGGCKNLSQRKRQQCQSRCQSDAEKQGEKKEDARQQVKQQRGAGLNDGQNKGS